MKEKIRQRTRNQLGRYLCYKTQHIKLCPQQKWREQLFCIFHCTLCIMFFVSFQYINNVLWKQLLIAPQMSESNRPNVPRLTFARRLIPSLRWDRQWRASTSSCPEGHTHYHSDGTYCSPWTAAERQLCSIGRTPSASQSGLTSEDLRWKMWKIWKQTQRQQGH